MTEYGTYIGMLTISYENSFIATINDLKKEIDNGCYYTAKEYCDSRYSTNLQKFKFDPYTGEKIDWKVVKNLLSELPHLKEGSSC